jgi:hypothetical protein
MELARWKRWVAAGVIGGAAWIGGGVQAQALKEGDQAPAFSAPASTGGTLGLKNFQGKVVVLWFYIGAFTKT